MDLHAATEKGLDSSGCAFADSIRDSYDSIDLLFIEKDNEGFPLFPPPEDALIQRRWNAQGTHLPEKRLVPGKIADPADNAFDPLPGDGLELRHRLRLRSGKGPGYCRCKRVSAPLFQ